MKKIGPGASSAPQVRSALPNKAELNNLVKKGKVAAGPWVKASKRLPKTDMDDLEAAEESAIAAFKKFLREPEEVELFGFVLDGKTSDMREQSEFTAMNRLVSFFRSGGKILDSRLSALKFVAVELPNMHDRKDMRVFTSMKTGGDTTIFLSSDLGLRDAVLAARDGYSDAAVKLAERLGVELVSGDVGRNLSDTVSTGQLPDSLHSDAAALTVVVINGELREGIAR